MAVAPLSNFLVCQRCLPAVSQFEDAGDVGGYFPLPDVTCA